MKPSLQLRFSQQLTLTPQLQQSIRLLQMSTLELGQEIEQALFDNPMLERADDPLDSALRLAPNGGLEQADNADSAESPRAAEPQNEAASDADNGQDAGNENKDAPAQTEQPQSDSYDADWQQRAPRSRAEGSDDESDYPQLAGSEASLFDHLMQQLTSTMVSPRDRVLVELLIGELNDDGYLQTDLTEIFEMLPAEAEIDEQEVVSALRLLQSFDPVGVGAQDLRQCLLLQVDALIAEASPLAQGSSTSNALALARRLIDQHLEILAAKDFNKLKRTLKCNDEMLKEAQAIIIGLSPRPGAKFAQPELNYIVPDVTVKKGADGWEVFLNPGVMPKLQVNDMYADILRRNRGISGNLSGQLQEARWLIKNVQQRFDTILRVSRAIVERQKAFFSHGEVAMRPLVLREIADTLGLHESTVSRVTTQKYMLTPHGTFELKYFFGSHVATDSGGAASSTAIRALIKQLIAAEDTRHPLSDNKIAQLLGEQGFVVARRTVAKYREALRIYPVSQRKTL
ncbi:MAG: RNA polymerase factor sigma-54 [Burkholderiaceae bacterium]